MRSLYPCLWLRVWRGGRTKDNIHNNNTLYFIFCNEAYTMVFVCKYNVKDRKTRIFILIQYILYFVILAYTLVCVCKYNVNDRKTRIFIIIQYIWNFVEESTLLHMWLCTWFIWQKNQNIHDNNTIYFIFCQGASTLECGCVHGLYDIETRIFIIII